MLLLYCNSLRTLDLFHRWLGLRLGRRQPYKGCESGIGTLAHAHAQFAYREEEQQQPYQILLVWVHGNLLLL